MLDSVRTSIASEQVLKAGLLFAMFSEGSVQICERTNCFGFGFWTGGRPGATTGTQNQDRVLSSEGDSLFFAEVYAMRRLEG